MKNREEEFYEDYLAKVMFNGSRYEVSPPLGRTPYNARQLLGSTKLPQLLVSKIEVQA